MNSGLVNGKYYVSWSTPYTLVNAGIIGKSVNRRSHDMSCDVIDSLRLSHPEFSSIYLETKGRKFYHLLKSILNVNIITGPDL